MSTSGGGKGLSVGDGGVLRALHSCIGDKMQFPKGGRGREWQSTVYVECALKCRTGNWELGTRAAAMCKSMQCNN